MWYFEPCSWKVRHDSGRTVTVIKHHFGLTAVEDPVVVHDRHGAGLQRQLQLHPWVSDDGGQQAMVFVEVRDLSQNRRCRHQDVRTSALLGCVFLFARLPPVCFRAALLWGTGRLLDLVGSEMAEGEPVIVIVSETIHLAAIGAVIKDRPARDQRRPVVLATSLTMKR